MRLSHAGSQASVARDQRQTGAQTAQLMAASQQVSHASQTGAQAVQPTMARRHQEQLPDATHTDEEQSSYFTVAEPSAPSAELVAVQSTGIQAAASPLVLPTQTSQVQTESGRVANAAVQALPPKDAAAQAEGDLLVTAGPRALQVSRELFRAGLFSSHSQDDPPTI